MKKYCYFFGLLVIHPLIETCSNSFVNSVKNSNHFSPPLKQKKHTQATIPAVQPAPDKTYKRDITALLGLLWLWTLARLYTTEKSHRISGWQLEELALLKIIKTNALRLWNNHRPDRKIIHLEA